MSEALVPLPKVSATMLAVLVRMRRDPAWLPVMGRRLLEALDARGLIEAGLTHDVLTPLGERVADAGTGVPTHPTLTYQPGTGYHDAMDDTAPSDTAPSDTAPSDTRHRYDTALIHARRAAPMIAASFIMAVVLTVTGVNVPGIATTLVETIRATWNTVTSIVSHVLGLPS